MKDITPSLLLAQRARSILGKHLLIRCVLTYSTTTYTYNLTRIKRLSDTEQTFSHKADLMLEDSDKTLHGLDLEGYKAVLSYGLITKGGEEWVPTAPLWVIGQQRDSYRDRLECSLSLEGIFDLMGKHKAESTLTLESDDTQTVKDLLTGIANTTLTDGTNTPYSNYPAYTITFDSGFDADGLIDVFIPADSFRVGLNETRLAKFKELMRYTDCVARVENDEEIHIFLPTTSGATYDNEYTLVEGRDYHNFFNKRFRRRIVSPNYITFMNHPSHDDSYTGYAKDASADLTDMLERETHYVRATGNTQCTNLAGALLSKYQMAAEKGSGVLPFVHFGQETYDYVNFADARASDNRAGNVGFLRRYYEPGQFNMTLGFGRVPLGVAALQGLVAETGAGTGLTAQNLLPLIENLYSYLEELIEILGTKINLDEITEGAIYKRVVSSTLTAAGLVLLDETIAGTYGKVLATQISAGKILLSDQTEYASGYNPTTKEIGVHRGTTAPADTTKLWLDTSVTPNVWKRWTGAAWVKATPTELDEIADGTSYSRILTTDISAGHILLSETVEGVTYKKYLGTERTKLTGVETGADVTGAHQADVGLDNLAEGTTYKRVLATQISAGKVHLSAETSFESVVYNPTTKINTFYQISVPIALNAGDLWFDTNDKMKLYRATSAGADAITAGEWELVRDTDIAQALADAAQAISDASTAQSTADGKIVTFYQATAPTAEGVGDLWLDTDDDRLYRWSGSQWIEIQDTDIASAISQAQSAQTTADSKIVTFYQAGIPTSTDIGDLWVDTDDKNKLYRAASIGANEIVAGEWEIVRDTDIAQALADAATAIADAATAQATADGKIVTFYQDAIPTSTDIGDLWIDTNDDNKLYRAECVGADEITAGEWVQIRDAGIAQAIAAAGDAQSTADGKIITFYQTGAPTAEGVGDLWVDTNDGNKLYRWSGAAWVEVVPELANATKTGEWYSASGVDIDATSGINIYGVNNALTTRATKAGIIQCYVGADGKIYAGAGAVKLDANGLQITGQYLIFKDGVDIGTVYESGDSLYAVGSGGASLRLGSLVQLTTTGNMVLTAIEILAGCDMLAPAVDGGSNLGAVTQKWDRMYINAIRVYSGCDAYAAGGADLGGTNRWKNIYGTLILALDYYAPLVEGMLCLTWLGAADLSIYSDGAWRTNLAE